MRLYKAAAGQTVKAVLDIRLYEDDIAFFAEVFRSVYRKSAASAVNEYQLVVEYYSPSDRKGRLDDRV